MRTRSSLTVSALAIAVVVMPGCGRKPDQSAVQPAPAPPSVTKLKLMLPCGMVIPVRAAVGAFEAQHPEVDMDIVLDNAVILARQIIEKGEKADLFISPGERQLGLLEEKGLVEPGSQRYFAEMTLAVAVPASNPAGIASVGDLAKANTITCPDPELNSSGFYAKRALTELGLWDSLQPRMVLTEHAIKSHQMVATGKSDAGFMYRRCPLDTADKIAKEKVKLAFELPVETYGPARAVIAVLRDSEHRDLAQSFADFLASEEGLKLIADNGLKPVDVGDTSPQQATVTVTAFYPGNEDHMPIKGLIDEIGAKYPDTVRAEFVDFQTDEGFERWQEAGLSCGTILINGEQTVAIKDDSGEREVTFAMGPGTYWTPDDLRAAVAQVVEHGDEKEEPQ